MIYDIAKISLIAYVFYTLKEEGMIFSFYSRWIERLPDWLYKPLGGCFVCLTGQTLFHYYWITHLTDWNIVDQLFYPSLGIALSLTYNYLYERA